MALTENDGNTVIVTSGRPFTVSGLPRVPGGQAVLMSPAGGGTWNVSVGPGCAGPWSPPARSGVSDPTASPGSNPGLGDPTTASKALQLCQGGGNLTVRGSLEALYNSDGAARTVNIVPLEQYVAGVVPNESPAGWGTLGAPGPQGQPWGFQELEAQAVAARSYVMAGLGSYGGYADTCDLDCQTYRGIANESALTDLAVDDTPGEVMEFPGGAVAATQYSASTGGYTAPGAFPAVADAGDSVCVPGACNPNHTWTTSVPVSTIDATWPALGTLRLHRHHRPQRLRRMGWAGDDHDPGRHRPRRLDDRRRLRRGAGAQVRLVHHQRHPGGPGGGDGGHAERRRLLAGRKQRRPSPSSAMPAFSGSAATLALARPVVGMASTPDGRGYWLVASDGGIFSYGDAHFYGSTGGHPPQPAGGGHGRHPRRPGLLGGGRRRGHLQLSATPTSTARPGPSTSTSRWWAWPPPPTAGATGWWPPTGASSPSATPRSSGRPAAIHLNQPVVGMAATPDGRGYWLVAADGGIFAFGGAGFYGSTGNIVLARPVVGMASAARGQGYWMVASDGGIFAFGDARFYGSAAG